MDLVQAIMCLFWVMICYVESLHLQQSGASPRRTKERRIVLKIQPRPVLIPVSRRVIPRQPAQLLRKAVPTTNIRQTIIVAHSANLIHPGALQPSSQIKGNGLMHGGNNGARQRLSNNHGNNRNGQPSNSGHGQRGNPGHRLNGNGHNLPNGIPAMQQGNGRNQGGFPHGNGGQGHGTPLNGNSINHGNGRRANTGSMNNGNNARGGHGSNVNPFNGNGQHSNNGGGGHFNGNGGAHGNGNFPGAHGNTINGGRTFRNNHGNRGFNNNNAGPSNRNSFNNGNGHGQFNGNSGALNRNNGPSHNNANSGPSNGNVGPFNHLNGNGGQANGGNQNSAGNNHNGNRHGPFNGNGGAFNRNKRPFHSNGNGGPSNGNGGPSNGNNGHFNGNGGLQNNGNNIRNGGHGNNWPVSNTNGRNTLQSNNGAHSSRIMGAIAQMIGQAAASLHGSQMASSGNSHGLQQSKPRNTPTGKMTISMGSQSGGAKIAIDTSPGHANNRQARILLVPKDSKPVLIQTEGAVKISRIRGADGRTKFVIDPNPAGHGVSQSSTAPKTKSKQTKPTTINPVTTEEPAEVELPEVDPGMPAGNQAGGPV